MKKLLTSWIWLLGSSGILAGADLASEWKPRVKSTADSANVYITSSRASSFGGVYTATFDLGLPPGSDGDAALILYNAVTNNFSAWANELGARKSTINESGGRMALRIKTSNGDYLSALYEPVDGQRGSFIVVFVDASEFQGP